MKLGPIVLKLRLGNTRFKDSIAGAAELAIARENTLLKEMAFVVPLGETCDRNPNDQGLNQRYTERFAVVVAIKNDTIYKDKLGITAHDQLHEVRAEIFKAILNWQVPGAESTIYYVGGLLFDIDPSYLWYQYEFAMESRLTDSDGVEEGYTDELEEIYSQFEITPSVNIPYDGSLPVSSFNPDMTTWVDIYDDPSNGAFSRAFDYDFDWYPKDDPWRY